ncbi:MAG: VCBS repeat-containing protein [Gammaproteobacteria bacterium]|nr:VCBS repeat-containing protein [Gammaproteobacteria bacterium]
MTTSQDGVFENTLIGPLEQLLDRTVAWQDMVHSTQRLDFPDGSYGFYDAVHSALTDLDSDGVVELNIDNRLYTLDEPPVLLNEAVFGSDYEAADLSHYYDYRWFADADDDGDLDLFLQNYKYASSQAFFENIGRPDAPVFVAAPDRLEQALESTASIGSRAAGLFGPEFPISYVSPNAALETDFDGDGDTDVLMAPGNNDRYQENIGSDEAPVLTEPFYPYPISRERITWITDFDSDGDLDVLVRSNRWPGELAFFEQRDGIPHVFKDPVFFGNFPELSATSFDYDLHVSRNLHKMQPPWFADLDGDGYQELLLRARYPADSDVREMVLITLRNGRFERVEIPVESDTVSVADQPRQGGAFFLDIDLDGDLDVVYRQEDPNPASIRDSFVYEQIAPLVFAPPVRTTEDLSGRYPILSRSHDIDLDDDGDLDTFRDPTGQVDINLERSPGSIRSFSTRSYVGESGADVQVGGFIIEGHSAQTVILRGLGPSLAAEGIRRPLQDPQLQLYSGKTVIASNDDWGAHPQADRIASAGIAPTDPKEAALRVRLNPGVYTVILKGRPGDTGVGIVAIDNDIQMPSMATQTSLSGRALIGPGENVAVGGFIIDGDTPVKVLLRGLGPSLAEAGIDRPLSDPTLTLYAGQQPILANDDWQEAANAAEIAALAHAPQYAKEAAILTELPPGTYTVHLRNADGTNGVGIVAVDRP